MYPKPVAIIKLKSANKHIAVENTIIFNSREINPVRPPADARGGLGYVSPHATSAQILCLRASHHQSDRWLNSPPKRTTPCPLSTGGHPRTQQQQHT